MKRSKRVRECDHQYLWELPTWPDTEEYITKQIRNQFACLKCHQNCKFDKNYTSKSIKFFNKYQKRRYKEKLAKQKLAGLYTCEDCNLVNNRTDSKCVNCGHPNPKILRRKK